MGLQTRMWLLVAVLFGVLYGVITIIGELTGVGGPIPYLLLAFVMLGLQYLIGPYLVQWTMGVKWVSEKESPELHQMVADLAETARLPKPRVGISQIDIPNAFAFGRTQRDGRICVTNGLLRQLNREELKAVLGHEMSHLQHRDMLVITLLSAVPMALYWIARQFMWGGMIGRRDRSDGSYAAFIGVGAMVLYFLTNLLVLYGSRIREYYADQGSVALGNRPDQMATALYKLAQGNAAIRDKRQLKQVEGAKAFFATDPARAWTEVRELIEIDRGRTGRISQDDLVVLRGKAVRMNAGEAMLELFTTHPNMKKRIKHLSTLVG